MNTISLSLDKIHDLAKETLLFNTLLNFVSNKIISSLIGDCISFNVDKIGVLNVELRIYKDLFQIIL